MSDAQDQARQSFRKCRDSEGYTGGKGVNLCLVENAIAKLTIGSCGTGRAEISTRESAAIPGERNVQASALSEIHDMYCRIVTRLAS